LSTANNGTSEYDNLVYSCVTCNLAKKDQSIPDPLTELLADSIKVSTTGDAIGCTVAANCIIDKLRLNHPDLVAYRKILQEVLEMARPNPSLYTKLVSYPDDLPDLSKLKPPGGNSRPEGIAQSSYERRLRGELPETY
jgi:hypothetical protein